MSAEHESVSSDAPDVSTTPSSVLFRPSKKRRMIYRQRGADDDGKNDNTQANLTVTPVTAAAPAVQIPDATLRQPGGGTAGDEEEVEEARLSVAEVLRLRKLRKLRMGGVEFRPSASTASMLDQSTTSLPADTSSQEVVAQDAAEVGARAGGVKRFAKQMGMVGDVDRHMMAYIDSEMARMHRGGSAAVTTTNQMRSASSATKGDYEGEHPLGDADHASGHIDDQKQPATLGKIQEIDLADEKISVDAKIEKKQRVRLGRDGKPWRSRKRRGSDDIKRDAIVEAVLRENKIEMYEDVPLVPSSNTSGNGENDDRVAEAFRREFMDAVSDRQRKKPPGPPPTRGPGGKKEDEGVKGPKLGGSRSARAAMREAQLKEAANGKK